MDVKVIWKVLSKEACGSADELELHVVCEAASVCVYGEEDTSAEDKLLGVLRSPFVWRVGGLRCSLCGLVQVQVRPTVTSSQTCLKPKCPQLRRPFTCQ